MSGRALVVHWRIRGGAWWAAQPATVTLVSACFARSRPLALNR